MKSSKLFSPNARGEIPGAFGPPMQPVIEEIPLKVFLAGGETSILIEPGKVSLERENQIGSGTTSRVYKGVYRDVGCSHNVAVKEFVQPLARNSRRKIDHEAKVMKKLDHPNLLRFFGWIEDSNSLVSEYLSKEVYDVEGKRTMVNNVRQLLDEMEEDIPWSVSLQIASDAARGLHYLHTAGCVH